MCASQDYEEVENVVFRSDKAAGTTLSSLLESSSKWVIAFLIGEPVGLSKNSMDCMALTKSTITSMLVWRPCPAGVTTAIAAFTVNWGVENIAGFKFWVTLMLMKNGWVFGSLVTYVAMNAALVFVAVSITGAGTHAGMEAPASVPALQAASHTERTDSSFHTFRGDFMYRKPVLHLAFAVLAVWFGPAAAGSGIADVKVCCTPTIQPPQWCCTPAYVQAL
jgi:hypothetical protein